MASTSLPVDISILEDQVIEVTEMEDGNTMEECMMFVKKLSETSLTEMEKEKMKLQELLEKAEKEMRNTKQALKRCCAKRDEWRDKCLLERDARAQAEKQVKDAKQRIQKMEAAVEEHKNNVKSLQQQKTRNAEAVKDLKEKLAAQKTSKKQTEDQLCDVKTKLGKIKAENDELQKRLFDESQKSMKHANTQEDQLAALKTQLAQEKTKYENLEKESDERVRHFEKQLTEQKSLNKKVSEEAEAHIFELEGKLNTNEEAVKRLEICNEEMRGKLVNAEKDSDQFEEKLRRARSENEILIAEKDNRVRELLKELKDTKEKLQSSESRLENAINDSKKESKEGHATESKSWANIVDEESLQELQERYDKLSEEHSVIQRQFAHLKKHRNQILRENNELHYHVQMATLQLASGNTRFRQQMDQFRVRLQVAESMYEDKVLECNMLDSQLKQIYAGDIYPGEVVYTGPGFV